MSLDASDVKKIARLARMQLREEEIPAYARQLSSILEFVQQMNAVDTAGVDALAHPLDLMARLRDDVVTEVDLRDEFQSIAPQVEAGLYLVPKVIE
jgi:aspartyl-tRNA(Asn)/glutamyl-tRNA(Gln) amidotransferase subunit C